MHGNKFNSKRKKINYNKQIIIKIKECKRKIKRNKKNNNNKHNKKYNLKKKSNKLLLQ